MKRQDYYTYVHQTPDGRVFYVGKGRGDRAHVRRNRNPHWNNIVAQHGGEFEVCIMADGLDEQSAYQHEKELIASMRSFGERLANATEGGDGGGRNKKRVCCVERREIFESAAAAGRALGMSTALVTLAANQKRVEAAKGLRFFYVEDDAADAEVLEAADKIAATPMRPVGQHRRPRSQEHRQHLSAINTGKTHSAETRVKLSAINKGKVGALSHNSKPIKCLTTGLTFPCSKDAAEWAVKSGYAKDEQRAYRAILTSLANGTGNSCRLKWARVNTGSGI